MERPIVDIVYTVERNQTNHIFFISDKVLDTLNLPEEVKEEISSFGAETTSVSGWFNENFDTVITNKIIGIFSKLWKVEYGVPRFHFMGATDKISDAMKHRSVILFIPMLDIHDTEVPKLYIDVLPFCSKLYFCSNDFSSTDHKAAAAYLRKKQYDARQSVVYTKSRDLSLRMREWYPNGAHEELMTAAKTAIDNFVMSKQINIFIPAFLVVPVYHIRRYQKATALICELYDPLFIMTLPITIKEKTYTVLFPIRTKG